VLPGIQFFLHAAKQKGFCEHDTKYTSSPPSPEYGAFLRKLSSYTILVGGACSKRELTVLASFHAVWIDEVTLAFKTPSLQDDHVTAHLERFGSL